MARTLQDRLALANVKVKNGWQDRPLVSIEPEIDRELKRKRIESNIDQFSDTSSIASGHCFSAGLPMSSPLTAPLFSDDMPRSGTSARDGYSKRFRNEIPLLEPPGSTHSQGRGRTVKRKTSAWKSTYELPQSSPTHYRSRTRPSIVNDRHGSFISERSATMHSPSASEDDDQDLPLPIFRAPAPPNLSAIPMPRFKSSPPRTPSPSRPVHLRTQESIDAGKEGADLLLFLAQSPSPAVHANKVTFPSTPETKTTQLPSSMMSTPGAVWANFQPITPGTAGFEFSAFLNISPSPAQQAWKRTPGAVGVTPGRTPRVHLESRRRLDFEGEVPIVSRSPTLASSSQDSTVKLQLGGELDTPRKKNS